MSGPVALGAYLILLALILIFNHSAHIADIDFSKNKAISSEVAFFDAPLGAGRRPSWTK